MRMVVSATNQASDAHTVRSLAVLCLLLSFLMPFFFSLGGLKLTGYRIMLLICMFPATFRWVSGKAGKIRTIDILLVCFAIWAGITLLINHGVAEIWQFVGMLIIEILAPYFIARAYIRNMEGFRYFVRSYFWIFLILLPLSLYEMVTGTSLLLEAFGTVMKVYQDWTYEPRLGLERAQVTMPHPILYGVFCSPAFALSWYVLGYGRSFFHKFRLAGVITGNVFASLSSGAWMNVLIQIALMMWGWILQAVKGKWTVLIGCFTAAFVVVELVANRNAFQIFATHLTLTPGTAWARINTFIFATDDVLDNPIFGIGLNDWSRPDWMLASVDNFWLVLSMRHGFPGLFLMLFPVLMLFIQVGRRPLTGAAADARLGYLLSLCGICISAITVHLWDATFCFFMFLLGAGIFFLEDQEEPETGNSPAQPASKRRKIRYTRFPKDPPGAAAE